MGAYNLLRVKDTCQTCGATAILQLQFKYGDVWQHRYQIGDFIKWGGNDSGVPGAKVVVADAVSEQCPVCGHSGVDYEVWIESDRITKACRASGSFDFAKYRDTFVVIEE